MEPFVTAARGSEYWVQLLWGLQRDGDVDLAPRSGLTSSQHLRSDPQSVCPMLRRPSLQMPPGKESCRWVYLSPCRSRPGARQGGQRDAGGGLAQGLALRAGGEAGSARTPWEPLSSSSRMQPGARSRTRAFLQENAQLFSKCHENVSDGNK